VALARPAPRRHRGSRRRDPHGPEGVGGKWPRRHLHRPARRLPELQGAVPRRPAARVGRVPELRRQGVVHRGAAVQLDVQDPRRPGGRRRLGRVSAARDCARHLRQLQERADDDAQEAAVRHRADRQVISQRDHARQLHLSHARVRADGNGVLRAARPGREVVRVLGGGALPLVSRPRHPRRRAAHPSPRPRRVVALLGRGAGESSKASPTAPITTSSSMRSSRAKTSRTSTRKAARSTCRT
jgi:hypothetical protein